MDKIIIVGAGGLGNHLKNNLNKFLKKNVKN